MEPSRRLAGYKAKREGQIFEDKFYVACVSTGVACTRIPDGCKQIGQNKIIRVKSPFDWVVSYETKTKLLDTKSTNEKNFTRSAINLSQLKGLHQHTVQGRCDPGYVVWFRKLDRVLYLNTWTLWMIYDGKIPGVNPASPDAHYIDLGSSANFDPRKLFP